MAGNALYGHAAGGYTGGPAYTAFSTEQILRRDFENIWLRESPLLAMIREGKKNWNKQAFRNGNLLLLPVVYSDASTVADGRADASELTPLTPTAIDGGTMAQFNIAHYIGALWHRASEKNLNNNARANLLDMAQAQLMDSFKNAIADDLMSTAADSRTAVLGIQQVLATANTVGNIDQSTNTNWQSNVLTSAGTFTLDMIDNKCDAVGPRRGKTDLILLAQGSSLNLFASLRSSLAPSQWMVNVEFQAKYGFTNIEYLGATCIAENRLTSGVICGLDTRTWFHVGDERPQLHHNQALTGTDADEMLYNMFVGVACNNPARNWRITGVTA